MNDPTKLQATASASGPPLDPSVVSAVAGAYYPRLVASAEAARSRSQSAYAVANALAGALVGATLLTTLATAPAWVRAMGLVSAVLWICGSLLFVRAIAAPLSEPEGDVEDSSDWVRRVVSAARADRAEIDRRQRLGNMTAVIALALSVASFASVLFLPEPSVAVTVDLTLVGQEQLSASCGLAVDSLHGDLVTASMDDDFLELTVPAGTCGTSAESTVWIAKPFVAGVRSD